MMSKKSYLSVQLSEDLWIEILARVPTNVVFKLRCLSKFYRALIDSLNFTQKLLDVSHKTSYGSYVLVSSFRADYFLKMFDIVTNSDAIELHKFIPPFNDYRCEGCCKGILLLTSPKGIMLWNPLTGASRSFSHDKPPHVLASYFMGHDEVTDDLKILKMMCLSSNCLVSEYECEIYSSKSDSWRKIIKTDHQLQVRVITYLGAAFVEGTNSIHMLARELEAGDKTIVAFDFSTEKFNRIVPPSRPGMSLARYISSLDGCLCVYTRNSPDGAMTAWMMKEYGATESWTPVLPLRYSGLNKLMPFDFVNDGRQFLLLSRCGVRLYDLGQRKLQKEVSFVEPSPLDFLDLRFVYTPSLRRV